MAVIQTAVLLMGYPAGEPLNLHGDVAWYHNYFFGPFTSQAAYQPVEKVEFAQPLRASGT